MTPPEKSLVTQGEKEKVLLMLNSIKKELELTKDAREAERALAKQKELEAGLVKDSKVFSELFLQLANSHLQVTPERLRAAKLGEKGFQHLDALVREKIGWRHKISVACHNLWNLAVSPAEKLFNKGYKNLGSSIGLIIILGIILGIPIAIGSLTNGLVGFLLMLVSGISLGQMFHVESRKDKDSPTEYCDQCHYLLLARFFKKHRGPDNYLPVQEIKQLL